MQWVRQDAGKEDAVIGPHLPPPTKWGNLIDDIKNILKQCDPHERDIDSLACRWEEVAQIEAASLFGRDKEAGWEFTTRKVQLRQALLTKQTIRPTPSIVGLMAARLLEEVSIPRAPMQWEKLEATIKKTVETDVLSQSFFIPNWQAMKYFRSQSSCYCFWKCRSAMRPTQPFQ